MVRDAPQQFLTPIDFVRLPDRRVAIVVGDISASGVEPGILMGIARKVLRIRLRETGDIARAIGQPGAARAVGRALASNPYAIIVPCHRVLAADGALNGFSAPGGIATKRKMLELEGAPGYGQQVLFG